MEDFKAALSRHPFVDNPYRTNVFMDQKVWQERLSKTKEEFLKSLELLILASRHGGSGGRACRDALLSLYNGRRYRASLEDWHYLDNGNFMALLLVARYQNRFDTKEIDHHLPQYRADFDRMEKEYKDEKES